MGRRQAALGHLRSSSGDRPPFRIAKKAGGAGLQTACVSGWRGMGCPERGLPQTDSRPPSALTTPSRGRKPRSLKKKPGHTAQHLPVQADAVRSPFAATGDREPQAHLLAPQQEHVCPLGSDQGSQSEHPMGAGLLLFAPSLSHDRKPFAGVSCRLTHCSESPSSCPPKAAVAWPV